MPVAGRMILGFDATYLQQLVVPASEQMSAEPAWIGGSWNVSQSGYTNALFPAVDSEGKSMDSNNIQKATDMFLVFFSLLWISLDCFGA